MKKWFLGLASVLVLLLLVAISGGSPSFARARDAGQQRSVTSMAALAVAPAAQVTRTMCGIYSNTGTIGGGPIYFTECFTNQLYAVATPPGDFGYYRIYDAVIVQDPSLPPGFSGMIKSWSRAQFLANYNPNTIMNPTCEQVCNTPPPPPPPPPPTPTSPKGDVRITDFTILDPTIHPSLTSFAIKDDPVVLQEPVIWVRLSNVGGQRLPHIADAVPYQISVVVREGGTTKLTRTYVYGKDLDPVLENIDPGGIVDIQLRGLTFFSPIDKGEIQLYLLPDSRLEATSTPGARPLTVLKNPDSLKVCLANVADEVFYAAQYICTIDPDPAEAELCADTLDRADLAAELVKCDHDAECVAKVGADWIATNAVDKVAKKVPGGQLATWAMQGVARALDRMNEPPPCTIVADWITAHLNDLINRQYNVNGFSTQSPVYPLAIDSSGRRAGFLSNGQRVNEIPNSDTAQVGEKRFVFYDGTQPVRIEVTGYAAGTMTLSTVFSQGGGNGIDLSYKDVPVVPGMKATLNSADTSASLNIDNNGDGRVDQARPPDVRASIGGGGSPPSGVSYSFPQTGFTVAGRLWDVWQGGHSFDDSLYINGLPITPLRTEVNPTDGKAYSTQWFERARFEMHPENQVPNDVLLGLLGVRAAQGRQGAAAFRPVGNPGGGITWFPQTQHTLGDGSEGGQAIASYWNNLGGLAQFGYPLSQPFMERSQDDGKTYLVQYFERQRFEYHPENKGTRYEVLLGRLGAEQVNGHVSPPPPSGQKWSIRLYNMDDTGEASLNGRIIQGVGFNKDSGWIDITDKMTGGDNNLRFQTYNLDGGYTWGFAVKYGDQQVWKNEAGTAGTLGANGNDQTRTQRVVYDQTLILHSDGTVSTSSSPGPVITDCSGIPPMSGVQLLTANCAAAGSRFEFIASGFLPNEAVSAWLTRPDGKVEAPFQTASIADGRIGLYVTTSADSPLGVYADTLQGLTSGHKFIYYFKLLKP